MLDEARVEFEKVVHTIPENLYAHKKLAEIYRDLGERDRAVEEFKEVLKLNPIDEWALTNLADIEKGYQLQPEAQAIEKVEEKPQAEQEPSIGIEEEELSEISLSEEDIDIYKKLLSIEPNNMQVMQRIEELKSLLKLLGEDKEALITRLDSLFNGIKNGKNKEALIARLDSLLNGIKKRRDEFFRSP